MNKEQIKHNFTYQKPTSIDIAKYEFIRDEAADFGDVINNACPESREKSIAITKLEECIMWANAAIARN